MGPLNKSGADPSFDKSYLTFYNTTIEYFLSARNLRKAQNEFFHQCMLFIVHYLSIPDYTGS